ncbi:MAG: DUF998 domain-containing protein [Flavobacteriaceae bacterium]|nr:DUF998 domain-containing protein [Flavobacteriaceae bacterium]NNK27134.1 DUF998 domain-containing protein [Flavobacteriaceae bacterium]
MTKIILFWFGILGVLLFVIAAILGGFQFDDYSHIQQFISESYATGTPYGNQLRYFMYLPSGILLSLFAFFAPRHFPKSKIISIAFGLFAVFYGLGTIVVSVFPCDEGCNRELIDPTISQIIHNLMGGLTYMIVPFAIIAIGIQTKSWQNYRAFAMMTLSCGSIALVFAWLMMANPNGNYIGLFQRLVEGSILFWVVNTAVKIKNT